MLKPAEPWTLKEAPAEGGGTLYTLQRQDIDPKRLRLRILARTETEHLVAQRVVAALSAFEGTPTALILAGATREEPT